MATTDPFALPAFILSIVGLVIAVLGAATGVVALVWQIVTRTRGAHRVVVKVTSGMNLVSAAGTMGPYYQIDLRNRGAAAVQVLQWSIRLPDGKGLVAIPAAYPPQPALPYMLDVGSTVSFYVLESEIVKAAGDRDLSRAQGVAHLGTGQLVKGKKGELKTRR